MKSDFLLAITQLAAERNLPKEAVFAAVEAALVSAYKRDDFGSRHNIEVKIHPTSGDVKVYIIKTVVEKPEDIYQEISLADAQKIKKNVQLGETVASEVTSVYSGRIAAQTAKQVVLQRLREAERDFIFGEYSHREGEIVSGVVERADQRQTIIDLGKAEGVLPASEQVRTEHYRPGQRLKAYLLEVNRTSRGPRLIISRSHPNLVKRLFELEVIEIRNELVEIKAIAREPGYRSKVAVAANQAGIDAVGACVGLRGVRIQNIVNELNGERIDVIQWNAQPDVFISNAMSPAQVLSVEAKEKERTAIVVVPDSQLSLAIGKDGQNARLAARLTGWRIDIKSSSAVEAERAKTPEIPVEEAKAESIGKTYKCVTCGKVHKRGSKIFDAHISGQPEMQPVEEAKAESIGKTYKCVTCGKVHKRGSKIFDAHISGQPEMQPVEEEEILAGAQAEVVTEELVPIIEEPLEISEELPTAEEVSKSPVAEVNVAPLKPEVEAEIPHELPELRFAEDIFAPRAPKPESRRKGKKKQKFIKEEAVETAKPKKKRKTQIPSEDEGLSDYLDE
ncbi:transcription termination factor NusA [Chloroflexota bacterium]